jgi:hypothetical protein
LQKVICEIFQDFRVGGKRAQIHVERALDAAFERKFSELYDTEFVAFEEEISFVVHREKVFYKDREICCKYFCEKSHAFSRKQKIFLQNKKHLLHLHNK